MMMSGCVRSKRAGGQNAGSTGANTNSQGQQGQGQQQAQQGQTRRSSANSPGLIVTPGTLTKGKVVSVNPTARFVVLTFPIGGLPALEKRLNVYRSGLKVGEIKITGPQRDNNTVADIVTGECQIGDEVRED
jgi:hypothetical protein